LLVILSNGHADSLANLLEIGAARLAFGEMRLESIPIDRRETVLEIVSDELHELAARHLGQTAVGHVVSVAAALG
jgi:hypothetical protein